MRIALIAVLGFCVVFVWSLIAAPGNDGPPASSTRFCGSWRPSGEAPRRHVAFANRMSCARALTVAVAYDRTTVCRKATKCRARVGGLKCFYQGTAGRGLTWIACETPTGDAPRAIFSVEQVKPS